MTDYLSQISIGRWFKSGSKEIFIYLCTKEKNYILESFSRCKIIGTNTSTKLLYLRQE